MTYMVSHLGQQLRAAGALVEQDGKDVGQMRLEQGSKLIQELGEKVQETLLPFNRDNRLGRRHFFACCKRQKEASWDNYTKKEMHDL